MNSDDTDWEKRVSELWAEIDSCGEDEFVGRIEALVAELPVGSAIGLFERGAAFDSTGHPVDWEGVVNVNFQMAG